MLNIEIVSVRDINEVQDQKINNDHTENQTTDNSEPELYAFEFIDNEGFVVTSYGTCRADAARRLREDY